MYIDYNANSTLFYKRDLNIHRFGDFQGSWNQSPTDPERGLWYLLRLAVFTQANTFAVRPSCPPYHEFLSFRCWTTQYVYVQWNECTAAYLSVYQLMDVWDCSQFGVMMKTALNIPAQVIVWIHVFISLDKHLGVGSQEPVSFTIFYGCLDATCDIFCVLLSILFYVYYLIVRGFIIYL